MRQELEKVEEYKEALQLSKDAEFVRLVQDSLSSPSVLQNKIAEEVLNESGLCPPFSLSPKGRGWGEGVGGRSAPYSGRQVK